MHTNNAIQPRSYLEARNYIAHTYANMESLGMSCVALDIGARTNLISLSDGTYCTGGGKSTFVQGDHRLMSWLHAWLHNEENGNAPSGRATNGGSVILRTREGPISGGFEADGVYVGRGSIPGFCVPLFVAASRAEFTFISKEYAKVTDSEGNVARYQSHTLELHKALICVGSVESGRDSSHDLSAGGFGLFTLNPRVFHRNECYTIEMFMHEFGGDRTAFMNNAVRVSGGNLRIAFIGEVRPKS